MSNHAKSVIWHNSVWMCECGLRPCQTPCDKHSAMAEKLHRGPLSKELDTTYCPSLHVGATKVVHCCRCPCHQLALWSSSTARSQSLVEWPAQFLVSSERLPTSNMAASCSTEQANTSGLVQCAACSAAHEISSETYRLLNRLCSLLQTCMTLPGLSHHFGHALALPQIS